MLHCNDPARGEFKYCMEGPEKGYVPAVWSGKEKNSFSKSKYKNLLFNLNSFCNPKGHGFLRFCYSRGLGGVREGLICLSL